MAFPTSPSNNDVHKEGTRSFVYDSALGVWDQVREVDSKIDSQNITSAAVGLEGNLTVAGDLVTQGNLTVEGELVNSTPLMHRNMIINGAMNVWQRGALAITTSNNGGFSLDRFKYYQTGAGQYAGTMTQYEMRADEIGTTGHIKALILDTTTAESAIDSADYGAIRYIVEAQDCQRMCAGRSSAKPVTLSFWAKSSVAGDYAVSMYQQDGDEIIGNKYTLAAETWTKVEITFAGNSTGTKIDDNNGLGLMFKWILFAGGNWTSSNNTSWGDSANAKIAYGHTAAWGTSTSHNFYLTGVQFELGSSATPFEHRSFMDEQQRCFRYYVAYGVGENGTAGSTSASNATNASVACQHGNSISSGQCFANIVLPVQMRADSQTFTAYRSFNGSGTSLSNANWGPFVSTGYQRMICIQKTTNSITTNQTIVYLNFTVESEL